VVASSNHTSASSNHISASSSHISASSAATPWSPAAHHFLGTPGEQPMTQPRATTMSRVERPDQPQAASENSLVVSSSSSDSFSELNILWTDSTLMGVKHTFGSHLQTVLCHGAISSSQHAGLCQIRVYIPPHLQWCADGATNFSSTAA
jgi:hypothetical protein